MSEILTNKITPVTGTTVTLGDSGDTFNIPSGANITNSGTATGFGGGKILQIISTHDTTARSQTGTDGGKTVLTGLAASITPSATSSKILISARWNGENGTVGRTHDAVLGIQRGGTNIGEPSSAGNRKLGIAQVLSNPYQADNADSTLEGAMFEYLDSPSSTSSLTYNITYQTSDGAYTIYTNRSATDADGVHVERLTSSITLWEIGV